MKSQIFKSVISIDILYELLDKICFKDECNYHLTNAAFNAGVYHNFINEFCSNIISFYHISKRHYVERKMNYNSFITIVRQICKLNNISYTSKIVYNKSNYEFIYYISISRL